MNVPKVEILSPARIPSALSVQYWANVLILGEESMDRLSSFFDFFSWFWYLFSLVWLLMSSAGRFFLIRGDAFILGELSGSDFVSHWLWSIFRGTSFIKRSNSSLISLSGKRNSLCLTLHSRSYLSLVSDILSRVILTSSKTFFANNG